MKKLLQTGLAVSLTFGVTACSEASSSETFSCKANNPSDWASVTPELAAVAIRNSAAFERSHMATGIAGYVTCNQERGSTLFGTDAPFAVKSIGKHCLAVAFQSKDEAAMLRTQNFTTTDFVAVCSK